MYLPTFLLVKGSKWEIARPQAVLVPARGVCVCGVCVGVGAEWMGVKSRKT